MKKIIRYLMSFIALLRTPMKHDLEQSNDDKILTDRDGNARVNMNNPQVKAGMRARMEELARSPR